MSSLVTLELPPPSNTFEHVRNLPVLKELAIDVPYGLVAISPKRHLYVVRINGAIERERLMAVPQVKGIHGDPRISATDR
jgi:hypothetical protein